MIDSSGGLNFYLGNNSKPPPYWDWTMNQGMGTAVEDLRTEPDIEKRYYNNFHDERMYERYLSGLRFIINNPKKTLKRIIEKFCVFWSPNSWIINHIGFETYGKVNKVIIKTLIILISVYYIFIMLFGIGGIVFSENNIFKFFILLFFGYYIIIHCLFISSARFHLPLFPLIILYASYYLHNLRNTLKASYKRYFILCLLVGIFTTIVSIYLPRIYGSF